VVSDTEGSNHKSNKKASVTLTCEDGSTFVFPRDDCALLPIVHATAEEMAVYLWSRILDGLNADYLLNRGIHTMEVIVAEAVGQEAVFRLEIPKESLSGPLDVANFVTTGKIKPVPCPSAPDTNNNNNNNKPLTNSKLQSACCEACRNEFSKQLKGLVSQLNDKKSPDDGAITVEDLQMIASDLKL